MRGYALGAGLQLALACDIRVVAAGTQLGLLEFKYGIMPDLGGTQRLPRLVGPGKAKELVFTAARIDAEEAFRIGLAEQLVDDAELDGRGGRARHPHRGAAAARGPRARSVRSRRRPTLRCATVSASRPKASRECLRSDDMREAIAAFVEGREPDYQGR